MGTGSYPPRCTGFRVSRREGGDEVGHAYAYVGDGWELVSLREVQGSGCSTAHQTEMACRRRAVAYYPPAPRVELGEQFELDSTSVVGTIRTNRTSPEVECVRKTWYDKIDRLRL
jgi:hypothetical protein